MFKKQTNRQECELIKHFTKIICLHFRFKNLPKLKESILQRAPKSVRVNYGLDHLALVTDTLHNLLRKGLGERVDLILQIVETECSWAVTRTVEKARKDG